MQAPLPDEVGLIIDRYASGLQSLTELTHIALSSYEPSIAQEGALLKGAFDEVLNIFLVALISEKTPEELEAYLKELCIINAEECQ